MKKGWKIQSWVKKKKCVYWVSSSLKIPIQQPLPKPHITIFKDLFDLEGCVMLTLVGDNLTNKSMGPKIILEHP